MPPRHAYWTILVDNQPTAFRAHDPEELLPTLNRLREKNDTAVMKWFERGQLFDSREAAKESGFGKGERRWEGPRPERREDDRPVRAREDRGDREEPARRSFSEGGRPRNKDWRPGGEHRDPRQKYKDAKKAKWGRFKQKIRERHEERIARDPEKFTPPHGDKLRARSDWDRREDREGRPDRPHGDRFRDQRPRANWGDRDDRPARDRDERPPRSDREDRPAWRSREDRPAWRNREDRPSGPARRSFSGEGGPARRSFSGEGGPARRSFSGEGGPARRSFSEGGREDRGGGFKKKPFGSKPSGGRKPWGAKPAGSSRPPAGRSDRSFGKGGPGGSFGKGGPGGGFGKGGPGRRSFSEGGTRRRRDEDE